MDCSPSHFSVLPAAPSMLTASGKAMAHSRPKSPANAGVSASIIGERVSTFLRGVHPARTADNVAADLATWRISTNTIRNMLERQTAPGAILWLALIDAYGPEFLAAAHPARLGWLDEAARAQRKATIEARMAALRSEMERL